MFSRISLIFLLVFSFELKAVTIGIIDSGVDYTHPQIAPNQWINPLEIADRRDTDRNGYPDDIYGWNFADQSPMVIDHKYVGTFSQNVYKFFDVQARQLLGTMTEEDKQWLREVREDKDFLKEMGKFGNFVHGTHVAQIAIKDTQSKSLAIKLIPTEVKPFFERSSLSQSLEMNQDIRLKFLQTILNALAQQQMTLLTEIAYYLDSHQAKVANGSFGTGYNQAKMIAEIGFKIVMFRKPTDEEAKMVSIQFINALVEHGQKMVKAAPSTLFVFASGNDGLNNDEFGTSPANIKASNVISVGASYGYDFLAPFSNYGKLVDVVAPGMLIESAIPGGETLKVSGTSQAAPYVANIAARILEENPKLSPSEVKKIIIETVDKKDFLRGKILSEGIVNLNRALRASELSHASSLDEAISLSKTQIRDVVTPQAQRIKHQKIEPFAMFSLFSL